MGLIKMMDRYRFGIGVGAVMKLLVRNRYVLIDGLGLCFRERFSIRW